MTNNETSKKTSGQVLKAILLFPFKLLWLLVKAVLILLVVIVLSGGAYWYVKSQQPMVVPEAKGMTYQQFMLDRYRAAKALDDNTRQNRPDHNPACVFTRSTILPVIIYYFSPIDTIAAILPESSLAYHLQKGDSYYERNRPTGNEPTWLNFPALHWEAIERESWTWYVIRDAKSRVCPMPPVVVVETP